MAKKKKRRQGANSSGQSGPRVQSRLTWWFLRVAPVVIALAAIGVYFGAGSSQGAAVVIVLGAILGLAIGLGALGSQVPPRDGGRGGAIEFGKPNRPS